MRNYELEKYLMHYGIPGMKRPRGLKYKTKGINASLYQNRQAQMNGNNHSGGGGGRIPDDNGRTHNGGYLDRLTQMKEKKIKSKQNDPSGYNTETDDTKNTKKETTKTEPTYKTYNKHYVVTSKRHNTPNEMINEKLRYDRIRKAKTKDSAKKASDLRENNKKVSAGSKPTPKISQKPSAVVDRMISGTGSKNSAKNSINDMLSRKPGKNSAKNSVNNMLSRKPGKNSANNSVNDMLSRKPGKNSAKNKVNEILYNPNSVKPLSKKQSTSVSKDTMNQTLEGLGIKKKKKKSGPKTSWRDE